MSKPVPIPIIGGPTASGKSAVAIALAERWPVEVVSADSRQVIRHLDIGTAKPTSAEQQKAPTHLIDLIEPGDKYSAARFLCDADRLISEILSRDHIPLVVGGTGLYLKALSDGVIDIDRPDDSIRQHLEQQMAQIGYEAMHQRLSAIDPDEARRIHPRNRVRVIRALEIYKLTGRTKTELIHSGTYKKSDFTFEYLCLTPPREQLYGAVNRRVDDMMQRGLLAEIQTLIDRGMKEKVRRANVIGYAELLRCIDGELSVEQAVDRVKLNTRRYAKRQLTWFRNQMQGRFYESAEALAADLSSILPVR